MASALLSLLFVLGAAVVPWTAPCAAAEQRQQRASRQQGAEIFHQKGCDFCHGGNGVGGGRGPDLSKVAKRLTRDQIERQIRDGGKAMPPFGDELHPDEVQSLIKFLRSRRKAAVRSNAVDAP